MLTQRRGGGIILLLMPFVLLIAGCATPYARVWQANGTHDTRNRHLMSAKGE